MEKEKEDKGKIIVYIFKIIGDGLLAFFDNKLKTSRNENWTHGHIYLGDTGRSESDKIKRCKGSLDDVNF